MPGQGLQHIPLRIPEKWDAAWFASFVRDVLSLADARNVIEGPGITIEGQSDVPATISSSEDIQQLKDQNYIVAEPSAFLANERVLAGENGVIELDDEGAGGEITIRLLDHSIFDSKLRESQAVSIIGRSANTPGEVADISASANDTVLRRVANVLEFGVVTFPMVQLSAASKLLGRGAGSGAGDMQEITLGVGISMSGTTLNASGTGGNITPDAHPAVADPADDEGEVGTAIDTAGTRFSGATPWTWRNQGGATAVYAKGSIVLTAPASASDSIRVIEQPLPGGAWTYRAKMTSSSEASYYICSLALLVAASGKLLYFAVSNNGGYKVVIAGFTNVTTFGGYNPVNADLSATTGAITAPKYFELKYDGATTWTFSLSVSGVDGTFIPVYSANVNTAFLGAAPDLIGIAVDSRTTATANAADWFRRIA